MWFGQHCNIDWVTGEQQGHIINWTKLFHFPKVQQEFTKKIGFSSLSLGGMFLADDPLIYCACPTVAHLVGSQHYGQNLISVQIPSLVIPRCTIRIDKYFFLSFEIHNVTIKVKSELDINYSKCSLFLCFYHVHKIQ